MAQHDYIISNATFPATRTDINNALSAIQTTNSGTSLPTGAVAGQIWLDTTGTPTANTLKFYDGTDSISLATINYTSNTVDWLDSSVSITGLSTTATGTVLTLSDSSQTSSVNLILQNQKEIRFSETTANGSNYVGFKAPASLTADKIWILPSADATVSGQALTSDASGTLSWTTISAGTAWQSVQTTGFTATSGYGYPCNTTSAAFTVTLPASPSVGSYVEIVDYAGTFDTNAITLAPNGNKINGSTSNRVLNTEREGVTLTYVDSTQGWLASSGVNEGTVSLSPEPYSVDFLVIAGGGGSGGADSASTTGGAGGGGGYRNSYSTETSGGGGSSEASLTFVAGTVYTVTVGGAGAGSTGNTSNNANSIGGTGSNSSISGSDISTITSSGGGGGCGMGGGGAVPAGNGGSGGGGQRYNAKGTGTANQGYDGGRDSVAGSTNASGGGGGSGSVGQAQQASNGGNGGSPTSSSITGTAVSRAGGGGGGAETGASGGSASGGGGAGGNSGASGSAGTTNTGGGAGARAFNSSGTGNAGGSGVVILRMPTANYSSTTTGSPTVTTDGSDKVIVFNASGTITG